MSAEPSLAANCSGSPSSPMRSSMLGGRGEAAPAGGDDGGGGCFEESPSILALLTCGRGKRVFRFFSFLRARQANHCGERGDEREGNKTRKAAREMPNVLEVLVLVSRARAWLSCLIEMGRAKGREAAFAERGWETWCRVGG